ncbi:MAG: ribbon-helix-helix domain-containing protein [bacterium]|nr:ribbon-helix-helix domain-containing protein [bacterium]
MTTVSVPLSAELLEALEMLVKQGIVPNKAEGLRQALKKYLEDKAVEAVLQARKEPSLEGDIDELAAKIV